MTPEIEKYNREIAGKYIETLPRTGWQFENFFSDTDFENGVEYHFCLTHKTAPFHFALDNHLSVYVLDDEWIKIYESVFNLVLLERTFNEKLPKTNSDKIKIHPMGHFDSIVQFENKNIALLKEFISVKCENEYFNAIYYNQNEVIEIGRYYDSANFSLYAIRYQQA